MGKGSKLVFHHLASIVLAFSLSTGSVCVYAEDIDPKTASQNTADAQAISRTESTIEENARYKDDEVIVVFDQGVSQKKANAIVEDGLETEVVETMQNLSGQTAAVVEVPDGMDVAETVSAYAGEDRISYVQPNYLYKADSDAGSALSASVNDLAAKYQWQLDAIHLKEAWDYLDTHTHSKIRVAVMDTGANLKHPDLQVNINQELSADITKPDGTGGYGAIDGDSGLHGTHVLGIIGATANNELGVTGVASGYHNDIVDVIAINVFGTDLGSDMSASTADVIAALKYAKKCGTRVVNMSFGGYGKDQAFENAINSAVAGGMVVVAAGGNEGISEYHSPSDCDSVISVISVDPFTDPTKNVRSEFSDFGKLKDICAPGSDILSTISTNGYTYKSGTSMSAPIITAVCAMMLSANPSLSVAQVKARLFNTATDLYKPGFDIYTANGLVNAAEAVIPSYSPVSAISLNKTAVTLGRGKSITLSANIQPSAASDPRIRWKSSDTSIATVTNGKIVGKKTGTATIIAWSGNKIASCTVNVVVPVKSISLNQKSVTLKIGQSLTLGTKLKPDNATSKKIRWKSSNKTVARVTSKGVVKALAPGTATIRATSEDGYATTICNIIVKKVAVKKLTLNKTSVSLKKGGTVKLNAKLTPANASDKSIVWKSSDEKIATVSAKGKVTAIKKGTVTITAVSSNKKKTASCKITVR